MNQLQPERVAVEFHSGVEIRHGDAHMVDRRDERLELLHVGSVRRRVWDFDRLSVTFATGPSRFSPSQSRRHRVRRLVRAVRSKDSPDQTLRRLIMAGRVGSVIVAGARTPMGRLLGQLKDFSAAQLGGFAIKSALERAGVAPEQVQYVIMGQVLTAGAGQIPARQAAVAAGIGMDVPALTINKVCLSGLNAIALADQLIRAGECEIVVAGGQESMTQAPHLLAKSRSGFKYGDVTMLDHMAYDGLHDAFDQVSMGASTEKHNGRHQLTRAEQDEFAAQSHQRAGRAV